jgi:hypothetical protein
MSVKKNAGALDFVVWPPLKSVRDAETMQCLAIASWFAGPIAGTILIPVTDPGGACAEVPPYVSLAALADSGKVRMVSVQEAVRRVETGDVTLLVRQRNVGDQPLPVPVEKMPGSQPVEGFVGPSGRSAGIRYYYIGTPAADVQDAYHAVCLSYWATGGEDKELLAASQEKLKEIKAAASGYDKVSIFGTGPSLEEAIGRDHSRSLNIICNTIVKNREFWSRLQPKVVVASDAHFHFSYHRYSARLLSDIAYLLEHSDAVFFTFDKFAAFLRRRMPSMAQRVFGIPAGRKTYGFDLDVDFRVFPGDSVLNMFLLPFASFLGNSVSLHGFTGRSKSDSYFWSHSDANQYSELMEDVRLGHPAFFRDRDYGAYADTVDKEIALRVDFARSTGKVVRSETTSFYSSFST